VHEILAVARYRDRILAWRWAIVVFLAVVGLAIEYFEHEVMAPADLDAHFLREALTYGVIVPLLVGFLLTALVNWRYQRDIAEIKAVAAERQRIAQELHDTIAPQLGFLHLELDRLAWETHSPELLNVQGRLAVMRDVAAQSYDGVRAALQGLYVATSGDLACDLAEQARAAGRRAGFKVTTSTRGAPRPLDLNAQRQAFYLFREALTNVEKHACAQHVDLRFTWTHSSLTIDLRDDGLGFNPQAGRQEGHFGLAIMQERSRDLQGDLTVISRAGAGTSISLALPLGGQPNAHPSGR
jgi:two-component system, NarL family, nitrate/nitrite sensor histidine kinase NarX